MHFYSDDHAQALMLELAQPLRDGGPAVAPWPAIAEPAYIAAWLDSAALIAQDRQIPARSVLADWDRRGADGRAVVPLRHLAQCLQRLPTPAESLCDLWDRHAAALEPGVPTRWQKWLCTEVWPRLAADRVAATAKLPAAVAKRERKRLSSKACPGAARWLNVTPVYRYEYLEDQEARDWFSWWMGVPLEPIRSTLQPATSANICMRRRCCLPNANRVRCSGEWRGFEDHVFGRCACSRVFMHDCAVLVLAKGLRKRPLRMPVEVETWEPSFPPPRAPDAEASDVEDGPDARLDLRIEELGDATVVVDYSLVGATNLYAPATAKTLFVSAQRGKHARYREYRPPLHEPEAASLHPVDVRFPRPGGVCLPPRRPQGDRGQHARARGSPRRVLGPSRGSPPAPRIRGVQHRAAGGAKLVARLAAVRARLARGH